MGILSRFFLLLYVLAVGTAVVICAGVCLHLIPTNVWQERLRFIIAQKETLIVLAVMLMFSLGFLGEIFSSKKDPRARGEITLKQGEPGEVKVSVEAIQSITERAALSVNGIREAKAVILKQKAETPISVNLKIVLSQGVSAPAVSEAAAKAVNNVIFTALQISNVPVDISVKDITNAVIERRQRVV